MYNKITKLGIFETQFEASNLIVTINSNDLPRIIEPFKWWTIYFNTEGIAKYVFSSIRAERFLLHRFLFNAKKGDIVDHKDRCVLNNKQDNFRLATNGQNRANSKKRKAGASKLKGVCFRYGSSKSWTGSIRINGKLKHLGYFDTEEEAARAYDKAALEAFGEFANLNYPI